MQTVSRGTYSVEQIHTSIIKQSMKMLNFRCKPTVIHKSQETRKIAICTYVDVVLADLSCISA